MNMPVLTVVYGISLIILGLAGYFGTGRESATALIPTWLGVIMTVLGVLSFRGGNLRKYAMHLAVVFSVLGIFGAAPGLWKLVYYIGSGSGSISTAGIYRSIMTIISLFYFIFAFKSFLNTRRLNRIDTDNDLPT